MTAYAKGKSPIIKGLAPGLVERGKIKIGKKGEWKKSRGGKEFQLPQKLDHFIITTLERDDTNNFKLDLDAHEKFGDKPKKIPIRLLYDDIALNFQCRYACFHGRKVLCSGDGEFGEYRGAEEPKMVTCPCRRSDPTFKDDSYKCKMNGVLSVLVDGISGVGGVWKYRTTGYNSTQAILTSLVLIKSQTRGPLAGIPLNLVVSPKSTVAPGTENPVLIQIVSIEFAGTMADLRSQGLAICQEVAKHNLSIADVENEARMLLSAENAVLPLDEQTEIMQEFYPDQATSASEQVAAPAEVTEVETVSPEPEAAPVADQPPPPSEPEKKQKAPPKKRAPKKGKPDPAVAPEKDPSDPRPAGNAETAPETTPAVAPDPASEPEKPAAPPAQNIADFFA